MASVPNMRTAPPPAAPGAAPAAEGEGSDLFASLLSIAPAGQTILDGPAATEGEALPAVDARIRPASPDPATAIAGNAPVPPEAGAGKTEPAIENEDDAVASDVTPPTDFIPILQAQSSYPVVATVVAAQVPDGSTTVTASAGQPAPSAPQPALATPAGAPDAKASNPGARVTTATAGLAGEDGDPSDAPALPLPAALKAALKATSRAKTAPAEAARVAMRAENRPETPTGDAVKPAPTAARGTSSPAAPAIQVPATPSAASSPIAPVASPMPAETILPATQPSRPSAPQPQAMDRVIEHELDLAQDGEWLDRLARDIARSGTPDSPLRFKLHPQTLGHLRVELTQGDQGMTVRLTAETEAARAIIADAQPRLLQEARAQGVRIAHAEVDLGGHGHQPSGDSRRHEDGRPHVSIHAARGAGVEAAEAAEPTRARSDRYA